MIAIESEFAVKVSRSWHKRLWRRRTRLSSNEKFGTFRPQRPTETEELSKGREAQQSGASPRFLDKPNLPAL
jgi:hypothetical protein